MFGSAIVHQYPAAQEPDINSGRNLIDAVNWDVISQLHGTRAPKSCRQKWYDNLAPSMVSRGQCSAIQCAGKTCVLYWLI